MNRRHFLSLSALGLGGVPACKRAPVDPNAPVRLGHFPNISHLQGLVAHQLSRQGKGWFEERLGLAVQWFTYNAGPSVAEAVFARTLDVAYMGPSPVLNAYGRSRAKEMRILAGAATGGSALVVRPQAGITAVADFRGKKVATPQLGNTQDVEARAWLAKQGFQIKLMGGGDVLILPTQNADQLAMFTKGSVDAVWTVEPWVSRLELEAGGRVFFEDPASINTLLVARARFLEERREVATQLVAAHRELTQWIIEHPQEARELAKAELTALTTAAPSDALLDRALARVILTNEVSRAALDLMVKNAQQVGFLKVMPPLDDLIVSL
jgi:NitT/TauT family transport system substrate-binding protein